MGMIQHLATGSVRPLPGRLLVGRAPHCSLRLDDKHVSGEHATMAWTGSGWEVRDLGSRNGTFIDGRRVPTGETAPVKAGEVLGFGIEKGDWLLSNDGPPAAVGENLATSHFRAAVDDILALPSADDPQVNVFRDGRGIWVAETSDGSTTIEHGAVLQAGDDTWRIHLPAVHEGTATIDAGPSIDTVSLVFGVSRNEEHVQVTVVHRGKPTDLEQREHGYVLLTLARARLGDVDEPLAEQGWLDRDQLLRMLGMDGNALNVAIYRARGQLSAAGVEGAAGVVEVRRGQRRLGIEPDRIEVMPL